MAKKEHSNVRPVTLETVDQAIYDWFDRTVDAHAEHQSGDRRKVPVRMAAGERFSMSRERKGVRDKNGVLILPILTVRRRGIEPQPGMQSLGTETARLTVSRRISGKTNNLMNLNTLRQPSQRMPDPVVFEVTSIPFPDRSVMTYELKIQTQYITQMNSVLEKIFHQLDLQKSFVAPFENQGRHPLGTAQVQFEERPPFIGGYVVGFFDSTLSDSDNFDEFTDQERIVQYSTNIQVPTTLQLDPEGVEPAVKIEKTAYSVDFGDERVHFVDDPLELELIFGNGKVR